MRNIPTLLGASALALSACGELAKLTEGNAVVIGKSGTPQIVDCSEPIQEVCNHIGTDAGFVLEQ